MILRGDVKIQVLAVTSKILQKFAILGANRPTSPISGVASFKPGSHRKIVKDYRLRTNGKYHEISCESE